MSTQNLFAIMEWPTDGHKLSIHRLSNIIQPVKQWNDFKVGDTGTSKYPGCPGDWPFIIRAVGPSKKSLEKTFSDLLSAKQSKPVEAATELAPTVPVDAPITIVGKGPSDETGQLRTSPRKRALERKSLSESTSSETESVREENQAEPKKKSGKSSGTAEVLNVQGNDSGPKLTFYSEELASFGEESKHKCNCASKLEAFSDELSRLRRRVRKLETRLAAPVSPATGSARVSATESISNTPAAASQMTPGPAVQPDQTNLSQVPDDSDLSALAIGKTITESVKKVAMALFTTEELRDCSITGKRSVQCGGDPRPPLDQMKLERVFRVLMARDPTLQRKDIVGKLQNIQKVIRRK